MARAGRVRGQASELLLIRSGMITALFDQAIDRLARGLEYTSRRHEVLAQNVANLETPGYRALDVAFDDYLKPTKPPAADATPVPLAAAGPGAPHGRLVYASDGPPREDGNDVNLDRQMARIAENTLFNHTLVQLLAARFATVKQAISGRV
jgi:flagellar basal-body rod protein FlgB